MKVLKTALVVMLFALLATAVSASDFDIGVSARSMAMGGAGLALGDQTGSTSVLNPAAPAASGGRVRFIWPGVSFHTTGASLSGLTDSLGDISDGNEDGALALVTDFAKQDTSLNLNMMTGVVGPFGVMLEASASGTIAPAPAVRDLATVANVFKDETSWDLDRLKGLTPYLNNVNLKNAIDSAEKYIAAGSLPADPTGDLAAAQAALNTYVQTDLSSNTVNANVAYGPTFMLSHGYKKAGGTLYLGTTAKFLTTEAHTWTVTANNPTAIKTVGTQIESGITYKANETSIQKGNTVGVDVGMIYKSNNKRLQYGAVINNFIEPDLKGFNNAQADRMLSVGAALVPVKGIIVAADLVNLNSANDENMSLRFGGEMALGKLFALRAGYSGQNWTYGVKVLGINMAFQGRTAQLLANTIKF